MTNYSVKISSRAKHVSLKITPTDGLVVVVPKGFNHSLLDDLVARRQDWIEKTLQRYKDYPVQEKDTSLPDEICLPALGEKWRVGFNKTSVSSVRVIEMNDFQLRVSGDTENITACRKALRRWLMRHAKQNLIPLLDLASGDCALPYRKATVRGQRTRWGSCSSTASINLNYQLLFVSPEMMNYVLVHELCHTAHLNHSRHFYHLLASFIPDYKKIESQLKQAWHSMPGWLQALQ